MNRLPHGIDRLVINILCRAKKELSIDEIIASLSKTYSIEVPNKHNLVIRVSRLAKARKIIRRKTDIKKEQYYKAIKGQKPGDDCISKTIAAGTVVKIKGKSFQLVSDVGISSHPKNFKAIEDDLRW